MEISPVNSVKSNLNVAKQENNEVNPANIEPKKDGKKKLALALGALAVAGVVTAGVKSGKFSRIKDNAKNLADEVISLTKEEMALRKNPRYIQIKDNIKKYENLLKKAGISEKTKEQAEHRISVLYGEKYAMESLMTGPEYLKKTQEKKVKGFVNNLYYKVSEGLFNRRVPEDKKAGILKELDKYTGTKNDEAQLNKILNILRLDNNIFYYKSNIKNPTTSLSSHIGLSAEKELKDKLTSHSYKKIQKAVRKDPTQTLESLDMLCKSVKELEEITGKSFKNLYEAEKFLNNFRKTLQY